MILPALLKVEKWHTERRQNAWIILKSLSCLILLFCLVSCQWPGFLSSGRNASGILKNPCVVLALPTDGPYAQFAQKIKRGAALARENLAQDGVNLTIENINTGSPDWISRLDALPPVCAIVGGPLQKDKYMQARKSGILDKRVFFSFIPVLQGDDEGKRAWRFFPGPQDQIDSLVKFVSDDLNIRTFASFYPQDSYGPRMSDLLEKSLQQKHIPMQKASYVPGAPASWSKAIKPLINPISSGGNPIPQTMFEALFLPDSWKNMDMITTSLLYNGEDRLALLGTTLWEQGLAGKQIPKAGKYALAIFPGAYRKDLAPKKVRDNGNDFWIALGYDFINFAVNTGIASRLENTDINMRNMRAGSAISAMAPINWDSRGMAHQNLYIFQVSPNGPVPIDTEAYKRTRAAILEQSALRMQSLRSAPAEPVVSPEPVSENIEPALPDENPAVSTPESLTPVRSGPAIPNNQIMRSSPQPSYKLRLPNSR